MNTAAVDEVRGIGAGRCLRLRGLRGCSVTPQGAHPLPYQRQCFSQLPISERGQVRNALALIPKSVEEKFIGQCVWTQVLVH